MGEMMETVEKESQNTGSLKVLIIDLENCPNQLHQLPSDLANYSRVVICYAQSISKVPLNWLIPLSTAIAANKLKIQKMERGGKNSADFGILFLCGALMHELPQETHFAIVSNDSDLDHAVHLLKSHGRSSERIGNVTTETITVKPALSDSSTPLAIYCAHLITYSKNRPAKADTLRNSIKNKFKHNPAESDKVYNLLLSNGAVKVSDNKVTYSDKKIGELAKH
ncbi:PIN domain-containing protein [Corticibacter populi]|uniref:PIN domain-containing protein n=1 Tax=Corticibacter populi TaxID=1550736 RepID=UPI001A91EB83|nr:PIN domain-containing protein [Corticibacter populi]